MGPPSLRECFIYCSVFWVFSSCAAGHCCACWRPSLGGTCVLLASSASREDPNFQRWEARLKANPPISVATSARDSSACWWSALPLRNHNTLPIYKPSKQQLKVERQRNSFHSLQWEVYKAPRVFLFVFFSNMDCFCPKSPPPLIAELSCIQSILKHMPKTHRY